MTILGGQQNVEEIVGPVIEPIIDNDIIEEQFRPQEILVDDRHLPIAELAMQNAEEPQAIRIPSPQPADLDDILIGKCSKHK
ncbi:hypothetical protein NQ317_004055 [Molorchus minor]|uniref:Uncharacterized protein n=1 Tax=Molorchus minor TaxID=1323400 RepID=A0ABQ9IQQ5_9CUCU|nr:hypothetical protein NQ317_004055 [Molorchus minor]